MLGTVGESITEDDSSGAGTSSCDCCADVIIFSIESRSENWIGGEGDFDNE